MKIIHTRLLFWAQGFTPLPWLIVIHPSRRGDEALLAHEMTHVEQMRRDGLLRFWWRYATKAGRLAYEVAAYKTQIAAMVDAAAPENKAVVREAVIEGYAEALCEHYFLRLTPEQAIELLS